MTEAHTPIKHSQTHEVGLSREALEQLQKERKKIAEEHERHQKAAVSYFPPPGVPVSSKHEVYPPTPLAYSTFKKELRENTVLTAPARMVTNATYRFFQAYNAVAEKLAKPKKESTVVKTLTAWERYLCYLTRSERSVTTVVNNIDFGKDTGIITASVMAQSARWLYENQHTYENAPSLVTHELPDKQKALDPRTRVPEAQDTITFAVVDQSSGEPSQRTVRLVAVKHEDIKQYAYRHHPTNGKSDFTQYLDAQLKLQQPQPLENVLQQIKNGKITVHGVIDTRERLTSWDTYADLPTSFFGIHLIPKKNQVFISYDHLWEDGVAAVYFTMAATSELTTLTPAKPTETKTITTEEEQRPIVPIRIDPHLDFFDIFDSFAAVGDAVCEKYLGVKRPSILVPIVPKTKITIPHWESARISVVAVPTQDKTGERIKRDHVEHIIQSAKDHRGATETALTLIYKDKVPAVLKNNTNVIMQSVGLGAISDAIGGNVLLSQVTITVPDKYFEQVTRKPIYFNTMAPASGRAGALVLCVTKIRTENNEKVAYYGALAGSGKLQNLETLTPIQQQLQKEFDVKVEARQQHLHTSSI